jgi:hypothetical protein
LDVDDNAGGIDDLQQWGIDDKLRQKKKALL